MVRRPGFFAKLLLELFYFNVRKPSPPRITGIPRGACRRNYSPLCPCMVVRIRTYILNSIYIYIHSGGAFIKMTFSRDLFSGARARKKVTRREKVARTREKVAHLYCTCTCTWELIKYVACMRSPACTWCFKVQTSACTIVNLWVSCVRYLFSSSDSSPVLFGFASDEDTFCFPPLMLFFGRLSRYLTHAFIKISDS